MQLLKPGEIEIFRGRAFCNTRISVVCDGEKHFRQASDGSRRYDGKCKDASNCPRHELLIKGSLK